MANGSRWVPEVPYAVPFAMASPRPTNPRSRAAKAALATIVVWAIVVVVGAGTEADDSLLGVRNFDIVWIVLFGIAVLGSFIVLLILKPWEGEKGAPVRQKKKSRWWVLPLIAVVLLIWRPNIFENLAVLQDVIESTPVEEAPTPEADAEPEAEVVAQATDLILLAVALGLILLFWRVLAHRGAADRGTEGEDQQLHDDMLASIDSLTLQLREGDDPRTAVLNAYATLESVLASHGGSRSASETPTEHLQRVLARLPLDKTPFVRLVRLYEVARFSDDVITPEQRQQAIASLEQARQELTEQA